MRSGMSFFSAAVFKRNFMRFWPLWAAYLLVWIFAVPVTIGGSGGQQNAMELGAALLDVSMSFGSIAAAVAGCASAMAVFSFMYSSKSACMIAALPVRREGMYLTSVLSGLVWLLGANLIVFLTGLCVSAAAGVAMIGVLFQWLGIVCLETLLFYGLACLCATLTGHLVVLPLVYAVFNFLVVIVDTLVDSAVNIFVYGARNSSIDSVADFSPLVRLANVSAERTYSETGKMISYNFGQWPLLVIYGAVGIACIAGGLLIYRRRNMETASDVVAVRPLKPVFKYCMAFGCALGLGLVFYSLIFSPIFYYAGSAGWLLVCMLVGGFIGYFAAEMLVKKTFAVFGQAWKGFAIFAFILVAVTLGAETDVFGYERYIPSPSVVEKVYISSGGEGAQLAMPGNIEEIIALHEDIVAHKKDSEAALMDMDGYGVDQSVMVDISYTMKNGSIVERGYDLPYYDGDLLDGASLCGQTNDILNLDEAIQKRKKMEIPVTEESIDYASVSYYDPDTGNYESISLTVEEAMELYSRCIVPDIEDGALGRVWIVCDDDYYSRVYSCQVYLDLRRETRNRQDQPEYEYAYFYISANTDSLRTNRWLEAKGAKLVLEKEIDW